MNIYKKIYLLFIILISGVFLSACSVKEEETKNEFIDNKSKEEELKNNIVTEYNPVIFEDEDFNFTKDIQDNLDKQFLLRGEVEDIYKEGEKMFIRFTSFFLPDYFGTFEINKDQEKIIEQNIDKDDLFNEFFIIVKIEKVYKPIFELTGEQEDDYVYVDSSVTDSFVLKGEVVDIRKIEN